MTISFKKIRIAAVLLALTSFQPLSAQYVPSEDNLQARQEFEADRFGIFLHWGIYSMFAQGEWYLNTGNLNRDEYAKAASGFYPILFDAHAWAKAFKDAGAKYVTITSRHHDGFSMFHTAESPYNIVDATPFKRDVIGELAEACREEGLRFHVYYSTLDWTRDDYPMGRTGLNTGKTGPGDFAHYLQFMKNQVRELLTNYPNIEGLWFDGNWDHDSDSVAFDWHMPEFYRHIHSIKPRCLVGNNHHEAVIEGEDFQMFERDLPGENTTGWADNQVVSKLPLEMCQTMNGAWGYKVADQNYKSSEKLIELLTRSASKGSNLLLNIGPQPNGELPAAALSRLKEMGQWLRQYGETIYGTQAGPTGDQPWGVSTQKGNSIFLHVFDAEAQTIETDCPKKPHAVVDFISGHKLAYTYNKKAHRLTVRLPQATTPYQRVVTLTVK